MIKRIVAFVLSLTLFSLPLAAPAWASPAEGEPVLFCLGEVFEAEPGGTASMPLYIESESGYEAHCLRLCIRYDAAMLTVKSVSAGEAWGELPDDCLKLRDYTSAPGVVNIAVLCPGEPMSAVGCLVKINFALAEGCEEDLPVLLETAEFFLSALPDSEQIDLPFETADGVIHLAAPAGNYPGDVNCDGAFSYSDITELYFYMLGTVMLSDQGQLNADFDGDGAITFNDISEAYLYLLAVD